MVWKVELSPRALRDLDDLDRPVVTRILRFLHKRVAQLDNPRDIGESLTGPRMGQLWKYRIGDYRIIASIEDGALRVLVVRIGHRREVYRQ